MTPKINQESDFLKPTPDGEQDLAGHHQVNQRHFFRTSHYSKGKNVEINRLKAKNQGFTKLNRAKGIEPTVEKQMRDLENRVSHQKQIADLLYKEIVALGKTRGLD
jgi:hypothetical protein